MIVCTKTGGRDVKLLIFDYILLLQAVSLKYPINIFVMSTFTLLILII